MPFRKLPNTDESRLQALQTAFDKAASTPAGQLAFSAATKARLDAEFPVFRTEMNERGVALAGQTTATEAQDTQEARVRIWTSHFYQNLNMGIERDLIPAGARAFYQLDVSQTALPRISSEADLILWAGRVVSGEAARIAAGGVALPYPPATEVATELNLYQSLRSVQSTKKDAFDAKSEDVEALRAPIDALILDLWDEVEFTFRHESASSLRNKAREYGVYYATRPGESSDTPPPPPPPPPAPAAPTGVTVTVGAGNVVTASWNAVTGATSYQVLKQLVGTDPGFVLAGTPTTPTLALGTFPPGATVRVKVRALTGTTPGPDSAVVETSVVAPPV